jgi:hypothetical protein
LQNALETWILDGSEAFAVAETIVVGVIAVLRKRFPNLSVFELELLLADVRRDIENMLFGIVHNTVDRDAAVDVIVSRFFGED